MKETVIFFQHLFRAHTFERYQPVQGSNAVCLDFYLGNCAFMASYHIIKVQG